MSYAGTDGRSSQQTKAGFLTTHWSMVFRARDGDTQCADDALEALARTYWPPIYGYLRRSGFGVHDAQDLTQEFLRQFLEKQWLSHLQDQRGKFRSFLLTFLKNFLSDQRDRASAQKRGGGRTILSIEACEAEECAMLQSSDSLSMDQIYDQRWGRVVMDEATRRLREEYVERGRGDWYDRLKDLQPGEHAACSYLEIAKQLGTTEQAVKNAVHSFRRRYGELLRERIEQTVANPAEVEGEIQHLLLIFAR